MLTHIVRHFFRMARPTNFRLCIQMEDNDPHQPQVPWPPSSKVTVARSRDQSELSNVSLAASGRHIQCRLNPAATLLVLIYVAWPACIAYGSLELTFKSVFIGLHAVSKLSYASCCTMHGLRRSQKTEICNACTRKTQCKQSILFFACVAFFVCVLCVRCVAYDSLKTDL